MADVAVEQAESNVTEAMTEDTGPLADNTARQAMEEDPVDQADSKVPEATVEDSDAVAESQASEAVAKDTAAQADGKLPDAMTDEATAEDPVDQADSKMPEATVENSDALAESQASEAVAKDTALQADSKSPDAVTDEAMAEDPLDQADSKGPEATVENSEALAESQVSEAVVKDTAPQAYSKSPDAVTDDSICKAGSKPSKTSRGTKRRASASNTMSVEAVVAKIKRLEEEAASAEATAVETVRKAEATAVELRAQAKEKRAQAKKVSQDYSRPLRDAALAELENSIRKKPMNPWFMFTCDVRPTLTTGSQPERTKKVGEMWANLSAEEKQKYKDRFEEESKKYQEWVNSEEGREILHRRSEILRQCKEESAGALAEATASHTEAACALHGTHVDKEGVHATLVTPVKQRRVVPARSPQIAEPTIDEKVLERAGQSDLVPQLRNLASRPEIMALKKTSEELLDALKAHGGIVNAAKRSLLPA